MRIVLDVEIGCDYKKITIMRTAIAEQKYPPDDDEIVHFYYNDEYKQIPYKDVVKMNLPKLYYYCFDNIPTSQADEDEVIYIESLFAAGLFDHLELEKKYKCKVAIHMTVINNIVEIAEAMKMPGGVIAGLVIHLASQ